MDRAGWSYVSGHVSALADRLMDQRAVLAVGQAGGPEELRARLRNSLLFSQTPPGERPLDEVEPRFRELAQQIAQMSPDPRIADLFLLGNEWQAFRQLARGRLLKKGAGARAEPAQVERFEAALRGEAATDADRLFVEAGQAVSAVMADEAAPAAMDRLTDPWEVAAAVRIARELESEELTEWVAAWARLRAALALIRAHQNGWDVPSFRLAWRDAGFDEEPLDDIARGGPSDWPSALEKLGLPHAAQLLAGPDVAVRLARAMDDRVTELAGGARGIAFGPEKVFAFLWALRMEALNLRVVLSAAEAGIPEARIVAELRAEYV